MARKLRLEYPGAIYHVINRGNYRRNVFETDKTKEAFKQCAFEAELQAEELARTGGNGWAERSRRLCQGWAIGSDGFKAALVKDYGLAGNIRAWESDGVQEVRELRWWEELAGCFQILERQPEEVFRDRKRAPWKLAIASWMKLHTQAANNWLSARLHLGSPSTLSSNLTLYRRQFQAFDCEPPLWRAANRPSDLPRHDCRAASRFPRLLAACTARDEGRSNDRTTIGVRNS